MFESLSIRRSRVNYQMPLLRLFSRLMTISLSLLPLGVLAVPK
jgi:hypothetical protein